MSGATRRMSPGLFVAAVLLGVLGIGGAAAMLASPEPTPAFEPTSSAIAATAQPTAVPSELPPTPRATIEPPPARLAAGDYAHLAVEALSFHDRPDGAPFAGINPGSDLWIVDVREDWYLVEAQEAGSAEYVFGWIPRVASRATGRGPDVEATLTRIDPGACERGRPQVYTTLMHHPQRQLECLADAPVVFDGYAVELGGTVSEPSYGGEPAWLAEAAELHISSVIGPAATGISVFVHLPPNHDFTIPMSERDGHDGELLRITGHFDDAASGDCERVPLKDGYAPMDRRLSELWCRQQLIVDAVELAPVATEWDEPPAYSFMLDSRCGERTLIGLFQVEVEGGVVVGLVGLDEQGRLAAESLRLEDVPTLPELVELAAEARRAGADEVTLVINPFGGAPDSLTIDWRFDVTDDEECYTVTDVATR